MKFTIHKLKFWGDTFDIGLRVIFWSIQNQGDNKGGIGRRFEFLSITAKLLGFHNI